MQMERSRPTRELEKAPFHLLDDYPGECYPNDILWAVAAIQRAAKLDGENHDALAQSLMETFNQPPVVVDGLPAFQMSSRDHLVLQDPRGSGNSGLLLFASELDPEIAADWYEHYEQQFWKDSIWAVGFTELPLGSDEVLMDVDSGPVLFEFGSVASGTGDIPILVWGMLAFYVGTGSLFFYLEIRSIRRMVKPIPLIDQDPQLE